MVFCCLKGIIYSRYVCAKFIARLHVIVCVFRVQGCRHEWYHYSTPEKGIGSFLGEMSGAVHNVSF